MCSCNLSYLLLICMDSLYMNNFKSLFPPGRHSLSSLWYSKLLATEIMLGLEIYLSQDFKIGRKLPRPLWNHLILQSLLWKFIWLLAELGFKWFSVWCFVSYIIISPLCIPLKEVFNFAIYNFSLSIFSNIILAVPQMTSKVWYLWI